MDFANEREIKYAHDILLGVFTTNYFSIFYKQ